MAKSKREILVETALHLFCTEGFRATGIDRILAESGVAKMTLYNHFKSKDELILAALRLRDERFRNQFMQGVESRTKDPRERLIAMFDVIDEWIKCPAFCGCTFINVAAEFNGTDSPAAAAAAEHKRLVLSYIKSLLRDAGYDCVDDLAMQLGILIDGAVVGAQVLGDHTAAAPAKAAAISLLDLAASPV